MYRLVCFRQRNSGSAVDQYSSSQTSLIFDPTSATSTSFLKLRERQSRLHARKKTPVDTSMRDTDACFLTPSIPAGRCVGALWVAQSPCPTYHLPCGSRSPVNTGSFHKQKNCSSIKVCFGCGGILPCSDWYKTDHLLLLHHTYFRKICRTQQTAVLGCLQQEAAAAEESSRAAVHVTVF